MILYLIWICSAIAIVCILGEFLCEYLGVEKKTFGKRKVGKEIIDIAVEFKAKGATGQTGVSIMVAGSGVCSVVGYPWLRWEYITILKEVDLLINCRKGLKDGILNVSVKRTVLFVVISVVKLFICIIFQ